MSYHFVFVAVKNSHCPQKSCHDSKPDNVNEHKTGFSKTGNNYRPTGVTAIVGDSILHGIDKNLNYQLYCYGFSFFRR